MSATSEEVLSSLFAAELDVDAWVALLKLMVEEGEALQNKPPALVPREDAAGQHVMAALFPFAKEAGGPLSVERVAYAEGRGNIIVRYPGTGDGVVSFVGSHLDVVPADEADWERPPFKLTVEGDELHGRGTTDCLGHVAVLTQLLCKLGELRPALAMSVVVVFIVDEEAGGAGPPVGVERLMSEGRLTELKKGPVYWVDCTELQPNIGSGGLAQFRLRARGKMCHSGFPHKGVNALELLADAMAYLQARFYTDYGPHPLQKEFNFEMSSSFKPTRSWSTDNSMNQIPAEAYLEGDIRLIPFYSITDCVASINGYLQELIDSGFSLLPRRGPDASYSPGDFVPELTLEWLCEPVKGLACDIHSLGFKALGDATLEIVGKLEPLADTGTLPLVGEMRESGYDLQTMGFGIEDCYHADNEFARISDFVKGYRLLLGILRRLHDDASGVDCPWKELTLDKDGSDAEEAGKEAEVVEEGKSDEDAAAFAAFAAALAALPAGAVRDAAMAAVPSITSAAVAEGHYASLFSTVASP